MSILVSLQFKSEKDKTYVGIVNSALEDRDHNLNISWNF